MLRSAFTVAASLLFWSIIGIEGACDIKTTIKCQVPSDGWSNCKNIQHDPKNCKNIPVSYKMLVCNKEGSETATIVNLTTKVDKVKKKEPRAKGNTLAATECKWMRRKGVINTCLVKHNWAWTFVLAKTATGATCKDYSYWEMTSNPIPTKSPTLAPTYGDCPLEADVTCNVIGNGWPSCSHLQASPTSCGLVPVSIKSNVCNQHHEVVQIVKGTTNTNGVKADVGKKIGKAALLPNTCQFQRRKALFDTCKFKSFWSWFRVDGKTLAGNSCSGYKLWEMDVDWTTLPPTPAPTTDECDLETNVSCQIVGDRVDNWDSCTNLVSNPSNCEVAVSIIFSVCNKEWTDSTDIADVEGVINGKDTTFDLFPVGREVDASGCVLQRKRVIFNTCENDHFWAWMRVVGDGGCTSHYMWSHTLT